MSRPDAKPSIIGRPRPTTTAGGIIVPEWPTHKRRARRRTKGMMARKKYRAHQRRLIQSGAIPDPRENQRGI